MTDINVSICCSSNRPHLWEYFYETVSMNTIKFEIIFIGPVEPTFVFPDNVKFIQSNVKPTQCDCISAVKSSGELLLFTPDDAHNSPFALDIMYKQYKKENDYKCIVGPIKMSSVIEQIESSEEILHIVSEAPIQENWEHAMFKNIQTQIGGMISRKFFMELGGFDKRFVFGHALTDVLLRALNAGGRLIFCPDTYMVERKDLCPDWQNGKGKNYTPDGWKLLMYEWGAGNIIQSFRTDELQPFEINDTLLTISQGPSGEWD